MASREEEPRAFKKLCTSVQKIKQVIQKENDLLERTKGIWIPGEHTDFTLMVKSKASGKVLELKCHKHILADNSPVLKAKLRTDFAETEKNQMKISDFEKDTVISFLKYLYAPVRDAEAIRLMRVTLGQKKYIFTRKFETEELTLDLLKMSHIYEVEDLQMDCAEYLGENLCDDNVVDVWMAAERMKIENLSDQALRHLISHRPIGTGLLDVPGFATIFNTLNVPIQHFVSLLATKAGVDMKEDIEAPSEDGSVEEGYSAQFSPDPPSVLATDARLDLKIKIEPPSDYNSVEESYSDQFSSDPPWMGMKAGQHMKVKIEAPSEDMSEEGYSPHESYLRDEAQASVWNRFGTGNKETWDSNFGVKKDGRCYYHTKFGDLAQKCKGACKDKWKPLAKAKKKRLAKAKKAI